MNSDKLSLDIFYNTTPETLCIGFNTFFPFLNLVVYNPSASKGRVPQLLNPYNKDEMKSLLKTLQRLKEEGTLEFSKATTTSELEEILRERFGIHAKVLRKSGDVWLETAVTQDWSLKRQNDEGQSLDNFINPQD